MSVTDAERMEASLIACAENDGEMRHLLFERFFDRFPDRRVTFYNVEAASRRMTDETLQMMHGLAANESWVWPLVTELVFTHRSYGHLPIAEYDVFIDMTVDLVGEFAGAHWDKATEAAWRRQAETLKTMIREARVQWSQAMTGEVTASH